MKRPLLPLAIAFALYGGNALALGLGQVHVHSRLNQPLDAEIPIVEGTAGEAEGLVAQLASGEDFDRVGIDRSRLTVPLQFEVVRNAHGQLVIRVTTKDAVREPMLDFLVEANWPKGRLLREYAVLLDPPLTAPAVAATPTSTRAVRAAESTTRQALPAKATPAHPATRAVAATRGTSVPVRTAANGEYGPVKAGDTLWEIASANRPSGVDLNRTMLAILKANPEAFANNNINALKRGAILRIPDAREIEATASAREAAAEVLAQLDAWRGGSAAPPVRVASTEAAQAPAAAPPPAAPKQGAERKAKTATAERLELVPPKAGKDSVAMAEQPGSGTTTGRGGTADGELRAELARVKEALTSREQEAGDLKSRVQELEDINDKNDRLITLKDSEIADLQRKLRELEATGQTTAAPKSTDAAAASPPTAPQPDTGSAVFESSATAAAPTAAAANGASATVPAKDIWGDGGGATSKPAEAAPATAGESGAPVAAGSTDAGAPPAGEPVATESGGEPPAKPAGETTSEPSASAPPPVATEPPKPLPAATKPVAGSPATATPRPAITTSTSTPWYARSWVTPAALAAGLLLIVLGLLGLRRRKPAAAPRPSVAGAFGDSPLQGPAVVVTDDADAGHDTAIESDVESLRDALQADPANLGLHLELLSIYYGEGDVARFEAAAEDMASYVPDADMHEWQQAVAMGRELAPDNPLFADGGGYVDSGEAEAFDETLTGAQDAVVPDGAATLVLPQVDTGRHDAVHAEADPASYTTSEFAMTENEGPESPADEGIHFELPPIETPTPPEEPVIVPDEPAFARAEPSDSSLATTRSAPSSTWRAPISTWAIRKAPVRCSTKCSPRATRRSARKHAG
jgi:pilus assembly protein FimV